MSLTSYRAAPPRGMHFAQRAREGWADIGHRPWPVHPRLGGRAPLRNPRFFEIVGPTRRICENLPGTAELPFEIGGLPVSIGASVRVVRPCRNPYIVTAAVKGFGSVRNGLQKGYLRLALAIPLLFGVAASADDSHTIVQLGRAFQPGEVTIAAGDTLTFRNQDEFIHQIYVKSDTMNFDSDEQPPGRDVLLRFTASGTFRVRCHIHPKMLLIVHVK
jgi:plastocyanin